MRALVISAIVSVAVIMVFGLLTPVLLQQAEAHIQGKLRGHLSEAGGHDGGVRHDSCDLGQGVVFAGLLHYIDANGNEEHDQNERTICLEQRIG